MYCTKLYGIKPPVISRKEVLQNTLNYYEEAIIGKYSDVLQDIV